MNLITTRRRWSIVLSILLLSSFVSIGSPRALAASSTTPTFSTQADINTTSNNSSGTSVNFSPTASSTSGGNVTVTCLPPTGSTFILGTTTVNCTATDTNGNTATSSFRVFVSLTSTSTSATTTSTNTACSNFTSSSSATTTPRVTLNGDLTMHVAQGSTFTDPGVTATNSPSNLAPVPSITTSGTVDTNAPGTYTLVYTGTDCAGHTTSVTRTVVVDPGLVLSAGGGRGTPIFASGVTLPSGSAPSSGVISNSSTGLANSNTGLANSTAYPGLPNTGAGGDATTMTLVILSLLTAALVGTHVTRKAYKRKA